LAFWLSFCHSKESLSGSPSLLACFSRASISSHSSVVGVSSKRFSFPLTAALLPARPLRSTGVTPLLRSYGPLRLPARADPSVMFSFGSLGSGLPSPTLPGLPGSSTDLSLRAVPNHPGRPGGCSCSLLPHRCQASSSSADWPPSSASRGRIGFACATARRFASPVSAERIAPPRSGSATRTNEQFTW